jgi:hypothetical protein
VPKPAACCTPVTPGAEETTHREEREGTMVSKPLGRRLQRLEQISARKQASTPCPLAPEIARRLASKGFVPESHESLADTMGRAMGLSMRELRAALQQRAAELPV